MNHAASGRDLQAKHGTTARRWKSSLAILAAAVLTMAPELALGLTVSDSYRFNLLWPEQFGDLFRSGHWYPRWLPFSWDGLGSPNFYFYPPLFFWVTSAFDALAGGKLSAERFVPLASLTMLGMSGLTMRAWLEAHVGKRRAIAGAVAYICAPYHLYDIYARGALAEAGAYAMVPLVMLALKRLAEEDDGYGPILAVSYAMLLLMHLPSALLVSVLLIPPYIAWATSRCARPVRFLKYAAISGLLGIALAAIYLVPALTLLSYVSSRALSGSFYRPENWFFWHVHAGSMSSRLILIIPVTIAAFMAAVATIRAVQPRSTPSFWAALTLILCILIAGMIPPFWKLPGLRLVQFPWRALLLAEFTVITMLTIARPRLVSLDGLTALGLTAFAYSVLCLMIGHTVARTWRGQKKTAAEIRLHHLDAPEYLPAGIKIVQGEGPDQVSFDVPKLPLVSGTSRAAAVVVSERKDASMTVRVDSHTATEISLHRFYFPHWRVRDAAGRNVAIRPHRRLRVVSFVAPAGRSVFRLDHGTAPYEKLGRVLTLIATLIVTLTAKFARRATQVTSA